MNSSLPRSFVVTILLASFAFGCGGSQAVPEQAAPPRFGPGLKMVYRYQTVHHTATFEVEVLDDSHLRWLATAGPLDGRQSGVEYSIRDIVPGVVFLSWTEANGSVVAQVVDLARLEVHAVETTVGGERLQLDGRIEIVREAN